ncbi:TPA: hypothetical protein ACX6R4_003372 [Photobacterium damselae]|uniref:hypothetical protein n=1 Tax=Photobacterium damselae TaxID=38293 RepID=UPI0040689DEE
MKEKLRSVFIKLKAFVINNYLSIFGLYLILAGAAMISKGYWINGYTTEPEHLRLALNDALQEVAGAIILFSGVFSFVMDRRFRRKNN